VLRRSMSSKTSSGSSAKPTDPRQGTPADLAIEETRRRS